MLIWDQFGNICPFELPSRCLVWDLFCQLASGYVIRDAAVTPWVRGGGVQLLSRTRLAYEIAAGEGDWYAQATHFVH